MMSAIQEKKCVLCGIIKGVTAFHKNNKNTDGRRSSCTVCYNKQRKDTFGASFDDAKSRGPALTNWSDTHGADLAWHIARERQQDLMHRNIPHYPSNEDSFRN